MDPQYLQNLHACLQQITAPTGGTEGIKNATKALNDQFYKSPLAIPGLYEILSSSEDVAVRQLAAVELRKRISVAKNKHWKKQPAHTRAVIKTGLLQLVLKGPSLAVNHAIARVVSSIADVELPAKQWPELLGFINTASGSAAAAEREIAIFTLYAILDVVVDHFASHLPQIYALFQKSLHDPESLEVRVTTVQALGKVAEHIDADEEASIATFQPMVPTMIQILEQVLAAGDEPAAKKIFDTFETLLILEVPLISPSIGPLVQTLATAGSNREVDDDLRIMSLNLLLWTVKFKKTRVVQLELVKPIVDALIQMGSGDEPEDPDEESVARTAFKVLDALATSLSPQTVFPPLYARIQECAASADPTLRKSAIMALGVAVEGCAQFIEPHMAQVWPFVERGLQDGDMRVRRAACTAVALICQFLGDDAAKRHAVLMPLITACLNDPECQRTAMTGLDAYVEELDSAVIGIYLHPLMERLLPMIDTAPTPLKVTILGVISSAAHAAKATFAPYFAATMQRISPFLQLTDEAELDLRGVAQDSAGTFAQAVGKEMFRPYLNETLKIAFDALNLDSTPMRECSILFFGVLAKVYAEEFVPFLPQIMPPLLASLGQAEGDEGEETSDLAGAKAALGKGFTPADDDDEEAEDEDGFVDITGDDDEEDEEFYKVTTALAIEKAVAADSLSEVFEHTKQAFVPYLETAVKFLVDLMTHFYPPARKSATTTLINFITVLHGLTNPGDPSPGLTNATLRPEVKRLTDLVVPEILTTWESDDDPDVVAEIATAFSQCISIVGIGVIAPTHLEQFCNYVLSILDRKSVCQVEAEGEEAEAATGELSEVESALIACAADLVGTLATALGPDFAAAFAQFFPKMAIYTGQTYSPSDRANAVGAIAEVINGLEASGGQYAQEFLNIGLTAVSDQDPDVRSNGAFLLGSLVYWAPQDFSAQNMTILGRLQPLFTLPEGADREKNETSRDNAAGAVARIILKSKDALPLEQVLPVFFSALPLLKDMSEYPKCLDAIYVVFELHHPAFETGFTHLLDVFHHALAVPSAGEEAPVTGEARTKLVEFLRRLNQQAPDQLAQKGLTQYL